MSKNTLKIQISHNILVECESYTTEKGWIAYNLEVAVGDYEITEDETIASGLLSGYCEKIVKGDLVNFLSGDYILVKD